MIFIFNRLFNVFFLALISLQLISCAGDKRMRLSSDFDFVARNNFIVYEVFASEPPVPDDFLDNSSNGVAGLTPNPKPKPNPKSNPKSKPDPKSNPSVPPQPPVNPPVPPQPPVDPQPDPQPPVYTCDGLKCPEFPFFPQPDPQPQPQPPQSFKYCDDFFDPLTGFDWSKLFSKEFSTCVWKSN